MKSPRLFLIMLLCGLSMSASAKVWHMFYGPDHAGYYVYIIFNGELGYSSRMKDIKIPSTEWTKYFMEENDAHCGRGRISEPMTYVTQNKTNHTIIFKQTADDNPKYHVLFTFAPDFSRLLLNYVLPDDDYFPYGILQLKDFIETKDGMQDIYIAQPIINYPKSEVLPLVAYSVDDKVGKDDFIGHPDIKFTIKVPTPRD